MAHLCLDHNVSHDLVPLLDRDGHDVITARDIRGERLSDDVLMLTTVKLGRIFITHNRNDFKMLHDAWVTWPAAFGMALPPHPGILVLDAAPSQALATALSGFLGEMPAERFANAIFWWHRRGGWDRSIDGSAWEPYGVPGDAAED